MSARPQPPDAEGLSGLARDTLHAVLDHLMVGIGVAEPTGAVLSLNAEALRIHGFATEREMLRALDHYDELFELRYPDGRPMPLAEWPISRAVRGEYVRHYDVDVTRRDSGRCRRVRYGVAPIHDDRGAVAQLVLHMVDRTEEEIAARALRVAESRFAGVFEHAATGIAIAGWDGRLLECNAAFAALLGYTQDELRRMTFGDVVHPDDREQNRQGVLRLQRGEAPSFEIENRYLRRDGTPVLVRKFVSVLPDASGRPAQLMALVTDVTVHRRAAEQSRWEAARNRLLLRLLRDQHDTADPAAVMAAAAEGLGALLGAARVGFFQVDGEVLTRTVCWTDGTLPPLYGPIPTLALGPTLLARCHAGKNTAIDDVAAFDWSPDDIPGLAGVAALVNAPVRQEGRWYAGVYVHVRAPRAWQPHEVALVSEIAHQAWEGIERLTARANLKLALEASAAGVWTVDLETRKVTLDDRSRALFGFAPGESVSLEEMSRRLHEEDRIHVISRLDGVRLIAGPDEWDMEFRIRRPDGTVAWVHGLGRAERDADGRAIRLRGIDLDVTARKLAQLDLRAVRDQQREDAETMRQLLEGAAQGIVVVDPAGRIETANPALAAMFGWKRAELFGRPLSALLPPAPPGPERHGQRRDGTTFPVEVGLNQVPTTEGGQTIAFVTDITERVRAGERLRESEQRLRRLASDLLLAEQHARERLARTLHDGLQQILFGATLKIDRAIKGRGDPDLLKRARGDVQDAIEAARSLSVELFPPALRQGGLPAALEWLAEWVHHKYGTTVHVAADLDANPPAEEVRLLLFESARELLFNAVKHAQATRITVTLRIWHGGWLEIAVADDGVGFDAAAAFSTAGTPRGGLGLFGIAERLALLGGLFDVDTAPGRGAHFSLRVPLQDVGAAPPGGPPSADAGARSAARHVDPSRPERRLKVLLVDDHRVVRDGLRELLAEQAQLEIVGEAADGVAAVDAARTLRPDVVVMDVSMPRLDGVEATRRLRTEMAGIEVFGLSTDERPEGGHAIEQAGASRYFSKNDGVEPLVAALLALHARLDGGPPTGV